MSEDYDADGNKVNDDDEGLSPNQQQQKSDLIAKQIESGTFDEPLLEGLPPGAHIDTKPGE